MPRVPLLIAGLIFEYVAVIGLLAALMPGALTSVDYLVLGTLATFVVLATLFAVLILGRKKKPKPELKADAGNTAID
jgi:hypothetical protein